MVLVSRKSINLLSVTATAGVLIMGVTGYVKLSGGGGLSPQEATLLGERFFYLGLLLGVITVIQVVKIYLRQKNVITEVDKIIELTSTGHHTPSIALKRLGPLGLGIARLHTVLNELNVKLSDKVSGLSAALEFLANNAPYPLLITDITGKILYSSREASSYFGKSRTALKESFVEDLSKEIIPQLIAAKAAEKSDPTPHTQTAEGRPLTVYPLYNRKKRPAYLLYVFGKHPGFIHEGVMIKE